MRRVCFCRAWLSTVALMQAGLLNSCLAAESFDKPLRRTAVDLGRSSYLMPDNPSRMELTCSYYPDFMIKQLDDPGLKGAAWIRIVSVADGHIPACARSRQTGEKGFGRRWSGYFAGVKGQFIFLDAADGVDGGMRFAVFDARTGQKLFEDSALRWEGHEIKDKLVFAHGTDDRLSMRYRRVVEASCSIPKGGDSCWNRIRAKYRLPSSRVPTCIGYSSPGQTPWRVGDPGMPPEAIETNSAVAYPVVATLLPRPSIKPVPGPVRCSPVD